MNFNPEIPHIGDILIAFGENTPPMPVRFDIAPWQVAGRGEGGQLWTCPPCPDWKGFPLHMAEGNGWKIYALGEFQPEATTSFDAQCLGKDVAGFNGRLLVLAWDGSEQRWHIWTDRFGTLHAYRTDRALSTFSPGAAAFSPRRLDWPALGGFFGFGFFPSDRTHFEGVRILRPATHTVLNSRGELLCQERYWNWSHQPDDKRSFDDTVDEFGRVFGTVMAEALEGGRVAIPLSGGLDSRSTAAVIQPSSSQLNRYWAYSYGYSDDSIETRIASRVAAARNLPYRSFTIQPYLFGDLERVLAWTEGFQDVTQARQAFVRDDIAADADSLVAALWGDVWLDDAGLAGRQPGEVPPAGVTAHTVGKVKKNGRAWLLEHVVPPRVGDADPEAQLSDWVQPELASLERIDDPDFRVKAYKTEQWSFRWSLAPIRVFQSAAWPRLVFYDTRLSDFFATLPSRYLAGRRLQVEYLKQFAPDLARIPWQVYGANLYHYKHFNTWLLPIRALRKAARLIRGRQVLQRNWEVQFLGVEGRENLQNWLARKGRRLHEFVPAVDVQALLDDFYARSDASLGYTVSMLLTFSAWLEKYG